MADSAVQVDRVVRILRSEGFTVIETPGWTTRGKGPMTTRGRIEHHTATRSTADAPTLRVVMYGHGSLKNSLSRWYVSRSGVIYLVALGVSWHAGRGSKGTNATLSGTEAEHSGRASEAWTSGSLNAQAAISRAESKVFGFPLSNVWDHKEHAPSRKVDRVNISPDAWRRRLAVPTLPKPQPVVEDDMAKLNEEAQEFYQQMYEHLKLNDARPTSLGNVLTWFRKIRASFL